MKTLLQDRTGQVFTITLNRPEKYNAFDRNLIDELDAAIDECRQDSSIRVLVITGNGKAFSAGIDLDFLSREAIDKEIGDNIFGDYIRGTDKILIAPILKLRDMPKPVIAAVNGVVAGAGFSLALAADIRVVSTEASFSMAFVKRGLVPDVGSTFLLPRLVGVGAACNLILTGDTIDANTAFRLGIAEYLAKPEEVVSRAQELASRIAANPPLAVALCKKAIYQGVKEPDLAAHCDFEIYNNTVLCQTADFREGVSAFLEKRQPNFQGK